MFKKKPNNLASSIEGYNNLTQAELDARRMAGEPPQTLEEAKQSQQVYRKMNNKWYKSLFGVSLEEDEE